MVEVQLHPPDSKASIPPGHREAGTWVPTQQASRLFIKSGHCINWCFSSVWQKYPTETTEGEEKNRLFELISVPHGRKGRLEWLCQPQWWEMTVEEEAEKTWTRVTYAHQIGSMAQRFPNLPKQHHQCSNLIFTHVGLWETFLTQTQKLSFGSSVLGKGETPYMEFFCTYERRRPITRSCSGEPSILLTWNLKAAFGFSPLETWEKLGSGWK